MLASDSRPGEHPQTMRTLAEEILDLVRVPSPTGHEKTLADLLESRLRSGPAAAGNRLLRLGNTLILGPEHLVPPLIPDKTETLPDREDAAAPNGENPESPWPGPSSRRAPAVSGRPAGSAQADTPAPKRRRPLVLIAGHIDTVPQADAPEPFLQGTRITGRGAVDMKAGVAVLLRLAETIPAEAGFADRIYILYDGEEGPEVENGLRRVLDSCPWVRPADLALLLEPSGGALELGCKGSIHVQVTFHGLSCHSARTWLGRHPLEDAIPWMRRVLDLPIRDAEVGGVVFREVASLTRIQAGTVRNVVPGTLSVNLNLRYAPDRSPEEAERYALSLLPDECLIRGERPEEGSADGSAARSPGRDGNGTGPIGVSTGAGGRAERAAPNREPPYAEAQVVDHAVAGKVWIDAPLMRRLIRSTGLPRRAKQGWTDVARFTSRGIPAVNWGPGDSGLCHTAGEYVDAEEAEECLQIMQRFLLQEVWEDDGTE